MTAKRILVVDNEAKMRRILELSLKSMGHDVAQAADGQEALAMLETGSFDLVLTDLRMPRLDGIGLLTALRDADNDIPVIVMTAYGTIETAVAAMKVGAADYVIRPFEMETIEMAVTRALTMQVVQRENRFLKEEVSRGWGDFVGTSQPMQDLYELLKQAAPARSSIFIAGETGTGKELVARAIHAASGRQGLFVPINCAAIPADLLESELFGHVKGAFTGALHDRIGKCELASGGTLFLDEITEMPIGLQAKLLRVLQESVVEKVGANVATPVDLRVLAGTNRDPQHSVDIGLLRRDLYFRLNVLRVDVPLLRDRHGDIPLLVEHFIHKYAIELSRTPPKLSPEALAILEHYSWPGNVRELENLIERAMVLCRGDVITVAHLPAGLGPGPSSSPGVADTPKATQASSESLALRPRINDLERRLIEEALSSAGNNKSAAARLLEISERALWYKIRRYGLG